MARASRRKFHYIYKTTCTVTGRYYIGMHSTDDLNDGYIGSGKRLWYSIQKHGKAAHVCTILEHFPDRVSLKRREREIIDERMLGDTQCMNLRLGGEGGFDHVNSDSEIQKAKNLKSQIAMKTLAETDPEWASRRSEKHRINMKESYRSGDRVVPKGFSQAFRGKKHTEETLQKLRNKPKLLGNKNGSFGSRWMTDPTTLVSKKISADRIEAMKVLGWIEKRIVDIPKTQS